MKLVAMIPARAGSKRCAKKNRRFLGPMPLVEYAVRTAKQSALFDEIYLNTDDFLLKGIAEKYNIKFYERDAEFASDETTNDEFVADFLKNVECDVVCQILPTSPFVTVDDLKLCVKSVNEASSVISVKREQISCLNFDLNPINFDMLSPLPRSQDISPVFVYTSAIMIWQKEKFLYYYEKFGSAYHNPDGNTKYVELKGLSTIDIDTEDDFKFAEQLLPSYHALRDPEWPQIEVDPLFYGEDNVEVEVPQILFKDGIEDSSYKKANVIGPSPVVIASVAKSEAIRFVNTEHNSVTLITQRPGEGNRRHYHPNWDEWWYIVDGEWDFEIAGSNQIIKTGDLVYIPKGVIHKITAITKASRLAVSRSDVPHVYV